MIIGCGGVASVAINKCCQNSEIFDEIMIASRTVSKCDALKEKLEANTKTKITTAKVDADNKDELVALINEYKPDAVLNVALPYQDLTIMDACLEAKVDYIDTANYEPEDTDDPKWKEIYEKILKEKQPITTPFRITIIIDHIIQILHTTIQLETQEEDKIDLVAKY